MRIPPGVKKSGRGRGVDGGRDMVADEEEEEGVEEKILTMLTGKNLPLL